jgi:hypothetical protein
MWSKLRFSIMTTTMCSICEALGSGSCWALAAVVSAVPVIAAADAAPAILRRKSLRLTGIVGSPLGL